MCAISSFCSKTPQSAYFGSPCSKSSGDFMGSLLVAPEALKRQKIWVMCAGTRESRSSNHFESARRRLQAPESSRMDVQTEGKA